MMNISSKIDKGAESSAPLNYDRDGQITGIFFVFYYFFGNLTLLGMITLAGFVR